MPDHNSLSQEISSLMRQRNYSEAEEKLREALELEPNSFWLRRLHADLFIRQHNARKAGPILRQLLLEQPEDARSLTLAGERHRLEGRHEEALERYLESLRHHDEVYTRTRAIDVLLHLKRHGEAELMIEEGLTRHPEDVYLLRRKAWLLTATSRTAEAAAILDHSAKDSGGLGNHDYAEALRLKLAPYELETRIKEVEGLLKISTHARNPYLQALVAELRIEGRQTEKARAALDSALELGQGDVHLMKSLGFLFNRLGESEKVIESLGQAFVHDPRDVVSQQVLLAAARKSNAWNQLRTILVLAYDRHPGFHKLNGLIKKIDHELEPPEPEPSISSTKAGTQEPSVSSTKAGTPEPSISSTKAGTPEPSISSTKAGTPEPSASPKKVGTAGQLEWPMGTRSEKTTGTKATKSARRKPKKSKPDQEKGPVNLELFPPGLLKSRDSSSGKKSRGASKKPSKKGSKD